MLELSGEMFEQIRSSLKGAGGGRRGEPRAGMRIRSVVTPLEANNKPGTPMEAHIRDISPTGIGLICAAPLFVGITFAICMKDDMDNRLIALYTVRRCLAIGPSQFTIGGLLKGVMEPTHLANTG
jgi:hypothetical protein